MNLTRNLQRVTRYNAPFGTFRRNFSYIASSDETFYAKDLTIEKNPNCAEKPGDDHQYTFGGILTDHMLHCDYDKSNGGW